MISKMPFWQCGPTGREGEYLLPIMPAATVGPESAAHVMGGAALATAIDALQEESGQPLLWATIQFLAPSQNAEELTIQCEQVGGGRSIGQWIATVRMRDLIIQRVSAAVGAREPSEQTTFAVMPDVPKPEDVPEKLPDPNGSPSNLIGQVERRIAMEDAERGIEAMWTRSRAGFALDAPFLAVVSDFFLGAHPQTRTGSSLDATFRFVQSAPPGWVLSVTELAAFERGTVSGHARHFSEDGKLLAISSQTGVLPRIPVADY